MERSEIKKRLGGIASRSLTRKVDIAAVPDGARLVEDMGIGSLEITELVFNIMDDFDIDIRDEEVLALKGATLADLILLIEKKLAARGR
jgi:acyl carrier protein